MLKGDVGGGHEGPTDSQTPPTETAARDMREVADAAEGVPGRCVDGWGCANASNALRYSRTMR